MFVISFLRFPSAGYSFMDVARARSVSGTHQHKQHHELQYTQLRHLLSRAEPRKERDTSVYFSFFFNARFYKTAFTVYQLQDPVAHAVSASQRHGDRGEFCFERSGRWHVYSADILCPQYLPVYTPSDEEKENPTLFASNVRKLMAKWGRIYGRRHARVFLGGFFWSTTYLPLPLPDRALEVPLADLSFEDRDITFSEGPLRIHDPSSLLEFNLLVRRLGWVEGTLSGNPWESGWRWHLLVVQEKHSKTRLSVIGGVYRKYWLCGWSRLSRGGGDLLQAHMRSVKILDRAQLKNSFYFQFHRLTNHWYLFHVPLSLVTGACALLSLYHQAEDHKRPAEGAGQQSQEAAKTSAEFRRPGMLPPPACYKYTPRSYQPLCQGRGSLHHKVFMSTHEAQNVTGLHLKKTTKNNKKEPPHPKKKKTGLNCILSNYVLWIQDYQIVCPLQQFLLWLYLRFLLPLVERFVDGKNSTSWVISI